MNNLTFWGYYLKNVLLIQGLAVASLCKTVEDVTIIGTASKHKHETIAEYFTHLFDHTQDYVQETKK